MSDAVVIPLKRFDVAKDRLRRHDVHDVTLIARDLARGVIEACAPRRVIVVCEDPGVADFASAHGAEVWHSDATGLNAAVQGAYVDLATRFAHMTIIHGDLAHPEGLGDFEPDAGITIVTDHRGLGTNVLALPTGLDFRFAYGVNSAFLHRREAERVGLSATVITDSPWGYDVDEPSDLER